VAKRNPDGTFVKGESGNPGGMPATAPDIKEIRKLNQAEAVRLLNKFNSWSMDELVAFCKDGSNTVLEMMVARIMIKGIKDGTPTNLNFLFDRLIGKVKDQVEHSFPKPTVIKTLDGGEIILGTKEKKDGE
jgi:hypothetical protein